MTTAIMFTLIGLFSGFVTYSYVTNSFDKKNQRKYFFMLLILMIILGFVISYWYSMLEAFSFMLGIGLGSLISWIARDTSGTKKT